MKSSPLLSILHVDSGAEWRGGQAQVLELLRGLRARNIQQALACPPGCELARRASQDAIAVFPIPMAGEWDLLAPRRIARIARGQGATLVHAHASKAHGLCWRALRRLPGTPLVVTRRVDFPVSGNWFSRRKHVNSRTWYIAISGGVRDVLITGGITPERVFIAPSGIDTGRFSRQWRRQDLLDEFQLPPETFLIVNVAALTDHKGQRYLIEAAPRVFTALPNARIFIVGEGELRADLERRIAELRVEDKIVLTGYRKDVEKFYAAMDLFVLSSHLEGLCTSLLDAQFFAKPAVATRTGGVPDVIQHGRNGLLVPQRDPVALAEAIIAVANDPEARARFGAEGRRIVEEEFTAARMVERTMEAYERILSQDGRVNS